MSGGGGGRYFSRGQGPGEIRQALREQEEREKNQAFESRVSTALGELLSEYSARDTAAVSKTLDQITKALESDIEGSVDPVFGGSVRKHTYVDGISDVDSLVVLKDPQLRSMSPQQVLDYFEEKLRKALPSCEVRRGQLAVTVTDGELQIQLLPAVKESDRYYIASAAGDSWSKVNPHGFFRQLTRANERAGMKLVPTIKLVKAINQAFPPDLRLTGYHLESLAVEAFRQYDGPYNTKAMLQHFFEDARTRVAKPITDKTGQSVHVDEYLGAANSERRQLISAALDRVLRRMKNADASRSVEQWLRLWGDE